MTRSNEARRGQALDEAIEQGLGLAVDPVQILEDHHQRLHLALAQEQALDDVERLLAPLKWIEGVPGRFLHRRVGGARRAGAAGASAGASVRTFPVTFSRILRGSSRLSIAK